MRKTKTKLSKVALNGRLFHCVTWPKIGKGRHRQFFKDPQEAKTFLQAKLVEQQNYGIAGTSFSERQRAEYLECAEMLQPFNATIRDAVKFYLPHLRATNRSCSAAELVDELLKAKKADGASERYIRDLRNRLGHFADVFDGRPVAEITSTQIDHWLRSLSDKETGNRLSPTTRNHFRRLLGVAFSFAQQHGYCVENPAASTSRAKEVESPVGILSVQQTARLLESAAPQLVPFIAIGAFAGLRRAELERLDWREIDLQSGLIEVTASNAKSARRRLVKIQPNLAQWLQPHAQLSGSVTPPGYVKLLSAAREAAGITDWPSNALRHSFASYHLARFSDAAALALELGHTNTALVFAHYRQLVKPKDAERYWKIAPAVSAEKVVQFAAE
jgi:integrase